MPVTSLRMVSATASPVWASSTTVSQRPRRRGNTWRKVATGSSTRNSPSSGFMVMIFCCGSSTLTMPKRIPFFVTTRNSGRSNSPVFASRTLALVNGSLWVSIILRRNGRP